MLVGKLADHLLAFWKQAQKGFMSVRRGRGNCWSDLIKTTELLVKFDIAKRASGRFRIGGTKDSSLN